MLPPAPVLPADSELGHQWALQNTGQIYDTVNSVSLQGTAGADVDAPLTWAHHTGSPNTIVAVVDTGVDLGHPDLALNVWIHQAEIPGYPDAGIYARLADVDGDGRITFWDLNDPANRGPDTIDDYDGNGFVDARDILRSRYCTDPVGPEDKDLDGDGIPDGEADPQPGEPDCSQRGWADGVDSDANGYVDDLVGWDFQDDDNHPTDRNFHGTHVAGIVGAVGDGSSLPGSTAGVAGIEWRTSLMALRILPPGGRLKLLPWEWKSLADVQDVLDFLPRAGRALRYAVDNGARVSNHSYTLYFPKLDRAVWLSFLTGIARGQLALAADLAYQLAQPGLLAPLEDAVRYADVHGHLVVVAAGNGEAVEGSPFAVDTVGDDLGKIPYYPASFDLPNVLTVAATTDDDALASFSNYGASEVDVAAPGEWVLNTTPVTATPAMGEAERPVALGWDFLSGTSMAAPFVAGVAALVWDENPDWTLAQVRDQILLTADPLPDAGDAARIASGARLSAARAAAPGAFVRGVRVLTSAGPTAQTGFADACGPVPAIEGIRLELNEALAPDGFDAGDVVLTASADATVPAGATSLAVLGVAPVAGTDDRVWDVAITPLSPDAWSAGTVSLDFAVGPFLLDRDGTPLDLDRDGAAGDPTGDTLHVTVDVVQGVALGSLCAGAATTVDLPVNDLGPLGGTLLDDLGSVTTDFGTTDLGGALRDGGL